MSWVDVQLPTGFASEAIGALVIAHGPLTFRLDLNPPWLLQPHTGSELRVQDVPELEVLATLADAGVPVLGARTRLETVAGPTYPPSYTTGRTTSA